MSRWPPPRWATWLLRTDTWRPPVECSPTSGSGSRVITTTGHAVASRGSPEITTLQSSGLAGLRPSSSTPGRCRTRHTCLPILPKRLAVAVMPKVAADAARAAEDVARQLGRPHFAALAALAGAAAALAVGRYDEGAEAALEAAQLFLGRGYQALGARSLALSGRCLVTQDRKVAVERLREAVEVFGICGCRWRRDQALETLRHLGKPGQRAAAASTGPGSLTGREREITALAVQGMSARAIGELLHIGERTVESHLARVYLKFGVHSREQLADAIALHAS